MSLLRWNTLVNVALRLSDVTGEAWSPDRILSNVLDLYHVSKGKDAPPPTCLRCAPPHGTKFGRYKWDFDNGTPSNPFVFLCEAPYQTVALYPSQVDDLLKTGETLISMAGRPENTYGREGEYMFIEPMEQGLKVGVSSVGISAIDLQEFAGRAWGLRNFADTPHIDPRAEPIAVLPPAAGGKPPGTMHIIKAHRNVLDPLIDRAIVKAGGQDPHAVFPVLRDMALSEKLPFTGNIEGGALHYTDDKGAVKSLTKDALAARLKRRRASLSDGN